jgi:hypothetical protein
VSTHDTQTLVVGAIIVLALIAIGVFIALQRRKAQSKRLQQRFGPEYGRVVQAVGDRDKAEAELKAREARVERFKLVPLAPAEAARFAQEWKVLQARFVDNPTGVVGEADRLVQDLMLKRGYPMGDFEHRAADISVHHPRVVENYRLAHAIAARERSGAATTEDLRKAVVHYRALFEDLLEVNQPGRAKPVEA